MALVNPRTPTGTARTLTGLVLIAGLVLTGCGSTNSDGDDEGTGGATSTPTTTTSTEPGQGEYVPASAEGPAQNVPVPELPEEAKEQSIEGAEATLEYWWKTLEYLYLTGDPNPLDVVSDSECFLCNSFLESIQDRYEQDMWYSLDAPFEVVIENREDLGGEQSIEITYDLVHPQAALYEPDGAIDASRSVDESKSMTDTLLTYSDSDSMWTVVAIAPSEEDSGDEN